METILGKCKLFAGMSANDIKGVLTCSQAIKRDYQKDSIIFNEGDSAKKIFILLSGTVAVGKYTLEGNAISVAVFHEPGELFGEVFVFLEDGTYDYFAKAEDQAVVLEIPKKYITDRCAKSCGYHEKLLANMLMVLAEKAYFLNKKLEVVSGNSLRQKIARFLEQKADKKGMVMLQMNREALALFLGTTRPSLSRELMNLQEEGIILAERKNIQILDINALEAFI